jgi:hypothetical protein
MDSFGSNHNMKLSKEELAKVLQMLAGLSDFRLFVVYMLRERESEREINRDRGERQRERDRERDRELVCCCCLCVLRVCVVLCMFPCSHSCLHVSVTTPSVYNISWQAVLAAASV